MKEKRNQQSRNMGKLFRKLAGVMKDKLPPMDWKRLLIMNIPYVIVFYLVDKGAWLYRTAWEAPLWNVWAYCF